MGVQTIDERIRLRRDFPPFALRRELRRARGLTIVDVAECLGVSKASVSAWERYRDPRGENFVAYAALLDRLARDP